MVEAGGTVSATTLSQGSTEYVYGADLQSTVKDGAYQYIESGGTASGTELVNGGREIVAAGGDTTGVFVFSNSVQIVESGGIATATFIDGLQGYQDVSGTAIDTTVNIGEQLVRTVGQRPGL